MEEITQFQREKYDDIINEIEEAQSEYERVKEEAAKVNDRLRVMKVLGNLDFAKERIFQARVRLFNNAFEISDTFPDTIPIPELTALSKRDNAIYYYVQIFISQLLHQKLIAQNWLINIAVESTAGKTCKCLSLKNRVSNPISVVIPHAECDDSSVEVFLIVSDSKKPWKTLKLSSIQIDISYKFNMQDMGKSVLENACRINRIYNADAPKKIDSKLLQYKFRCDWPPRKFIETFLINSCHKLDLARILNKSENFAVKLMADDLANVELNPGLKLLTIEAVPGDLFQLKKYFLRRSDVSVKKDFDAAINSTEIKELIAEIVAELNYSNVNLHNLLNVYDKYLRIVAQYPL